MSDPLDWKKLDEGLNVQKGDLLCLEISEQSFIVSKDFARTVDGGWALAANASFVFSRDTEVRETVIAGVRQTLPWPVRVAANERVTWQELVRRSERPKETKLG